MERPLERFGGLDVHKETVAACVRVGGRTGQAEQHVQTFGTTIGALLVRRDWLAAHGVTHVAMESTGVYWKPVFYALESDFTGLLVNAAHIKQVPGRKTDVKDCVWIAPLLEHGLLRGSFVPPAPIRDLRDLTRYRKALIHDRTRVGNRLHKALEEAGMNSLPSPAISSASLGAPCSRPWSRARPTPPCWPTSRGGDCAGSSRRCAKRWPTGSGPTTPS